MASFVNPARADRGATPVNARAAPIIPVDDTGRARDTFAIPADEGLWYDDDPSSAAMRSATLVLICYGLMVVTGVVWFRLPIGPFGPTPPDLAALTAGYLGLTARRGIAGAVAAAVVTGYLADLLSGTPPGLFAVVAGVICVLAFLVQRRILVRGRALTLAFAASLGLVAEILVWLFLAFAGEPQRRLDHPLLALVMVAVTTAVVGLGALRLYRRVDAAFARTHRERDHALEGLTP